MKKRGQILGQPIIFILALIIGALVLTYGLYYTFKLKDVGESIELSQFVLNLREDVQSYYYLDSGSSKVTTIRLPSKLRYVCFKGKGSLNNNEILERHEGFDFILQSYDQRNIFFLPFDAYTNTVFNIDNLEIKGKNPLCFKNGEKAKITTQSTFVEISHP
jgi:hypothetical protein